jgi:hypothetical protein
MATVYVAFARGDHTHDATAAFSRQSDAESYCQRQTNLERQRHGNRAATTWQLQPIDVDALA